MSGSRGRVHGFPECRRYNEEYADGNLSLSQSLRSST